MKVKSKFSFSLVILFTVVFFLTGCSKDGIEATLINFSDGFSDENSGWFVDEGDNPVCSYTEDETYKIEILTPSLTTALAPISKLNTRYNLEVDIEHLSDEGHSGLVFNSYKEGNRSDFYVFRLDTNESKYMVSRFNDFAKDDEEKATNLTEWKSCSPDENQFNSLKIVQENKNVTFYLNEEVIEEFNGIEMHEEGIYVGFFVSSDGAATKEDGSLEESVAAQFDNFKVRGYAVE